MTGRLVGEHASAPSVTATLQILATVASPNPQTNTASVGHSDQFDPDAAGNQAAATETPQRADLALTKTVSNSRPDVGDTITFIVTLANNGPDSATGVIVDDPLPAGLSFVSATPSQGTYDSATGVWTVGTVTSGTSQTLQIQVRVVAATSQANTASVSHSDQFDPNTANNTASAHRDAAAGRPGLDQDSGRPDAQRRRHHHLHRHRDQQRPQRRHRCHGGRTSCRPGVTSSSRRRPARERTTPSTGLWTCGYGQAASSAVLGDADDPRQGRQPRLRDQHGHDRPRPNQFDPDTANSDTTAIETPQQADLRPRARSVKRYLTPNVDDTITFVVTLTDNGLAQAATNVQVTDLLPAGLTFVSATPSQGTYDAGHRRVGRGHGDDRRRPRPLT